MSSWLGIWPGSSYFWTFKSLISTHQFEPGVKPLLPRFALLSSTYFSSHHILLAFDVQQALYIICVGLHVLHARSHATLLIATEDGSERSEKVIAPHSSTLKATFSTLWHRTGFTSPHKLRGSKIELTQRQGERVWRQRLMAISPLALQGP